MTFSNGGGNKQRFPWSPQNRSVQKILNSARACAKKNRFNQFHKVLKPLISQENPEALFLAAEFSRPRESEKDYERRYVEYIQRAAARDYPPALHALGTFYDLGDAVPVIPIDKKRAAQIFKRGADLKHACCQYSHALDLLYGANGIEKDVPVGLALLQESVNAKCGGSLRLLAHLHEKGEFGLPVDLAKVAALRMAAEQDDVICF